MKNINLKELFKNKSVIYLSVVLGLLLVIGVSYAYFSITVNGNEEAKDITVTTGNLSLYYNSGPELKVDNIQPGKILIKEFTVTNTGDFDTEFDINMVDMINTIEKDELVFSLDCVSYEKYGQADQTEIGTCDGQGTTPFIYSEVPTSQKLKGNNPIKTGITNKYTLTITFNETGSVQNYNQGKKFIGKIQINEYNYNDSNVPVINNAKIDNLLLTALLKDTNGLSAYAVTSADAEEPSSWKNVSKNEYTVSDRVDDYDKKLWVKNVDGNIIYKDLTPISNLTIDPAGGTYNGSIGSITTSERYKTEIELSDPTREGYTFSGWNVTGERSTLKDSSTAMLTNKVRMMSTKVAETSNGSKTLVMGIEETKVTATWRQNNYDLTINPNGGSYNGSTGTKTSSVTYGTDVDIPDPVREGYTFTGWTVSSDKASLNGKKLTMGLEDCTLTANWAINSYPWIAYHNKMNVTGSGYTLVSADTKEGEADFGSKVTPNVNTYTGFTSPSTKTITIVVDTKPSTKNVVNYNYDRNKYTLTINPNGGTYNESTSSTTTSEYFETVKTIKSPTKTGYTFKNWTKTGNSTLTDTTLLVGSENTTLTANYEANKYTVSFNANGGNVDTASKDVTYNGTYGELPTATREGHEFLGWFTDASSGVQIKEDSSVTITANQTLYAHWKELTLKDLCQNTTLATCLKDNYKIAGLAKIDQEATGNQNYDATEYRYQGGESCINLTMTEEICKSLGGDKVVDNACCSHYYDLYYKAPENVCMNNGGTWIDDSPNNYITFNDETGVWRIIGVFEVETPNGDGTYVKENKVKIIRDSIEVPNYGTVSWNSCLRDYSHQSENDNENSVCVSDYDADMNGKTINDWTSARAQILLNSGAYYNRSGMYSSIGLTDTAKKMISTTKWYLGNIDLNSITADVYSAERGNRIESGNKTTWDGNVALMYPSDYMYASKNCTAIVANNFSTCTTNNWLKDGYGSQPVFWTLNSPISNTTLAMNQKQNAVRVWEQIAVPDGNESYLPAIIITSVNGDLSYNNQRLNNYGVNIEYKPTLYLSSSIEYIGGSGTTSDPFIIK